MWSYFIEYRKRYLFLLFLIFFELYAESFLGSLFYYFFKYNEFHFIESQTDILYFYYTLDLYLGSIYNSSSELKSFFSPENFVIQISYVNEHMCKIIILPKTLEILWALENNFFGSSYIVSYYFYDADHFLYFSKLFNELVKSFGLLNKIDYTDSYLHIYLFTLKHYYWVCFCEFINLYDVYIFRNFPFIFSTEKKYAHLFYHLKYSFATIRVLLIFRHINFHRFVMGE